MNQKNLITVESVWCADCGEIRPVRYDYMKGVKHQGNDHDATDVMCDRFHVIATLHHPHALAKFLGAPSPAVSHDDDPAMEGCSECGGTLQDGYFTLCGQCHPARTQPIWNSLEKLLADSKDKPEWVRQEVSDLVQRFAEWKRSGLTPAVSQPPQLAKILELSSETKHNHEPIGTFSSYCLKCLAIRYTEEIRSVRSQPPQEEK